MSSFPDALSPATREPPAQAIYPPRPTWLEIDLSAIAANVGQLRCVVGESCRLMAVVKGNAYGHGDGFSAAPVARAALAAGADRLAVACLSEGVALRQAGVRAPILVLGYTPAWQADQLLRHDLTATVYELEIVQALAQLATSQQLARIHVKINTGMNRLGIAPHQAVDFFSALQTFAHVEVEGVFTHFSTSDELDKSFALTQFARFQAVLAALKEQNLRPPLAHAANSAAIFALPQTHLQMVRSGIALYGLHPEPISSRLPAGFQPALSWRARVAQVMALAPGESVSYGREFIAERPMRAAVIPVGYADGFPRRPHHWGHLLIHGQPAPILGRVCMDQTIVDITHIDGLANGDGANGDGAAATKRVQQGDEVVLLGQQGAATLSVDEAAARVGTNNYDIVSRILPRVPRIYIKGT